MKWNSEDAYAATDRRALRVRRDEGEDANAGVPEWAQGSFPWASPKALKEQDERYANLLLLDVIRGLLPLRCSQAPAHQERRRHGYSWMHDSQPEARA